MHILSLVKSESLNYSIMHNNTYILIKVAYIDIIIK